MNGRLSQRNRTGEVKKSVSLRSYLRNSAFVIADTSSDEKPIRASLSQALH